MNRIVRKILATLCLIGAIAFIVVGVFTKHDVRAGEKTVKLSDRELVSQASFSGVLKKNGQLETVGGGAVDKSGEKACPT